VFELPVQGSIVLLMAECLLFIILGIVSGYINFHGDRKPANCNADVDDSADAANNSAFRFYFPD